MPRTPTDYSTYDEIVVRRLVSGEHHPGHIRTADRGEAVRRLVALGFSDGQMAYRLGMCRRQVTRIRVALGLAPALPSGSNREDWRVQAPTLHWRHV